MAKARRATLTKYIGLKITPEDRALLEAASEATQTTFSEFVRQALTDAAAKAIRLAGRAQ